MVEVDDALEELWVLIYDVGDVVVRVVVAGWFCDNDGLGWVDPSWAGVVENY